MVGVSPNVKQWEMNLSGRAGCGGAVPPRPMTWILTWQQ